MVNANEWTFFNKLDKSSRQEMEGARDDILNEFSSAEKLDLNTQEWDQKLFNDLKTNKGPDYKNPNIAASYLRRYNLSHCAMAFQIFFEVFKSAPHKNIYVCDVGAGIAAGLTGILLALERQAKSAQIYFDAVECSEPMRKAAKLFIDRLELSKNKSIAHMRSFRYMDSSFRVPDLPKNTIKIVSAFHLSWPYHVSMLKKTEKDSAYCTLNQALEQIRPHQGLFTSNEKKMEVLKEVVRQYFDSSRFKVDDCGVPNANFAPFLSPSEARCLWYRLV